MTLKVISAVELFKPTIKVVRDGMATTDSTVHRV